MADYRETGAAKDFTEGSIWKGIFRMSWPMLLIMLLNFGVGFTDIYVAGLLGAEVQAAVGFIEQLYFLLIILGNAISIGSVAIISRAVGANDTEETKQASRQCLGFGLIIAIVLTAVGLSFPHVIVAAAGFPPEISEMAVVFLRIFSLSLGFNYFLIISSAILRSLGTPEKPLIAMTILAVLNLVLDFALVFGWFPFPRLGYAGIAASTSASVFIATLINVLFLMKLHWSPFFRKLFTLSRSFVRRLLSLSWPMVLVMIAWNAGTVVLYNILAHLREGYIDSMAAYANGLRIEAIIFLPAFALNMAASVLIGQNLGAHKVDRAVRLGWQIAVTSGIVLGLMAAVLYIFAPEVASILAQDPLVLEDTITYLRYNLLVAPIMAMSLSFSGSLQGAGDTRGVMMAITIAMWVIRLPLAYCLGVLADWGAKGVWSAMILSMCVQGMLLALRFQFGRWKTRPV